MILQFNLDRLKSKDFQLFSIIISYPSFALPCLNSSILKYIYQKYNITLKQLKVKFLYIGLYRNKIFHSSNN